MKFSATVKKLHQLARAARKNAHAPYSNCNVGAALIDSRGKIYSGCNVENSTYGATVCAERSAISAMVAGGGKTLSEIVVSTPDGWLPCGICRQVLMEFAPNPNKTKVYIADSSGLKACYTLSELLPSAFSRQDLFKARKK